MRPSTKALAAAFLTYGLVANLPAYSQQAAKAPAAKSIKIDKDDIGGTVAGPNGPEAGVWVVAETRDQPVRYIKIVVTDDQGRFVIPDLPKGTYDVWARGYGLIDSDKQKVQPGKLISITAKIAPD